MPTSKLPHPPPTRRAPRQKPSVDDIRHTLGQAVVFLEAQHWPAFTAALAHAIRQTVAIQNHPQPLPNFKGV